MHAANQPVLADALWSSRGEFNHQPTLPQDIKYILDGESLLQRSIWPYRASYDAICDLYVNYVIQKYGKATVGFDSYSGKPSTKDATHKRRKGPHLHIL